MGSIGLSDPRPLSSVCDPDGATQSATKEPPVECAEDLLRTPTYPLGDGKYDLHRPWFAGRLCRQRPGGRLDERRAGKNVGDDRLKLRIEAFSRYSTSEYLPRTVASQVTVAAHQELRCQWVGSAVLVMPSRVAPA